MFLFFLGYVDASGLLAQSSKAVAVGCRSSSSCHRRDRDDKRQRRPPLQQKKGLCSPGSLSASLRLRVAAWQTSGGFPNLLGSREERDFRNFRSSTYRPPPSCDAREGTLKKAGGVLFPKQREKADICPQTPKTETCTEGVLLVLVLRLRLLLAKTSFVFPKERPCPFFSSNYIASLSLLPSTSSPPPLLSNFPQAACAPPPRAGPGLLLPRALRGRRGPGLRLGVACGRATSTSQCARARAGCRHSLALCDDDILAAAAAVAVLAFVGPDVIVVTTGYTRIAVDPTDS